MGIASLVLGIISLIVGFIPCCGMLAFIPAAIGIILGIVDIVKSGKTGEPKGKGIAGIILSVIAVIVIFIWVIIIGTTPVEDAENSLNTLNAAVSSLNNTITTTNDNTTTQEPVKTETDNALVVDCDTLYEDYQNNPISGDEKYKGKILKLTGEVYNIDREIAGNPYITFHIGDKYSLKDIRITFKKSEEEKVTKLTKGQKITIKGRCKGTLLSTTVALDDCEIVE